MVLIQLTTRVPLTRSLYIASRQTSYSVRRRIMASASPTLYVKGDPDTNTLGDCPFCHRVLLTMEQKSLDYERGYIAFSDKPQWLFDVNPQGTVPVLKDEDVYVPDSGAIVEYLEEKFPNPPVPEDSAGMAAVDGIFGAFREYFLNQDTEREEALKETLHGELEKLEAHLASIPGPFLGGSSFNASDASFLPKLYHMSVALGHFKQWEFPEDCSKGQAYLQAAEETDVWKRCRYSSDLVLKGWGSKLQK